jgi:DNA-binding Lrp family transcriptional regulator
MDGVQCPCEIDWDPSEIKKFVRNDEVNAIFMHMDSFDRKLLAALQRNGAQTNQELADTVGLSPSQISRRRQQLEVEGTILRYEARLSPEKLGFGLRAFVNITLAAHSPHNSKRFLDLVARTPEILEAHALTGNSDYLLKVVVADLRALSALINETLLPHESVDRVRSEIVLETLKETAALPIEASS